MPYTDQIESLVRHFKSGEKEQSDFSVGMEFEHFILHRNSFESVSYYQHNGVEALLRDLTDKGWQPVYENEHIIGLEKCGATITLEPGGQIELSAPPRRSLRQTKEDYFKFLYDAIPTLDMRSHALVSMGYQPVTCVSEISFLPKKRYGYMQTYLKAKGKYAHNMMKGTASTQVSIDYSNELDYIKKNRIINFLSPLVYCMFDNAPFFEGLVHNTRSARSIIWDNCDPKRCGSPADVFTERFGYESYARYILSTSPILYKKDNMLIPAENKQISDVFDPETFSRDELEYLLTMVFPDARTKTFIEIRMADSLPFPYNLSYAAFWKGLLYNSKNLNSLYAQAMEYRKDTYDKIKEDIRTNGVFAIFTQKTIFETFEDLLDMSMNGLNDCEKNYLLPLISLTEKGLTLKDITLNNLEQGLKDALRWCVLNEFAYDGGCAHIACR